MPRTKIVQASAKKTCFQFAERRQSFAKIAFLNDTSKSMRLDFRFRRVSVCQRAIRLREAFIFYPLPTEDSLWFLHIGKGQTFQEMTFAMRGNANPFGKRLSPCAEMPNRSGNDFRRARKCQTFRETTFAKRGNAKPFGKRLPPCAEMPNHSGNLLDEDVFYFFQTLIPILFMDGNVAHLFKPRRLYSRSGITIPSRNPTPTFERHKITSSSSIMTISCA